jgi:hypothetical protein
VIRSGVIVTLSVAGTVVWAGETVEIQVKYPVGRVLLMKSDQNNVTDAAGMRIVQMHAQEIEEEVLPSDAGLIHLRLTYQRQTMRTESPMGSMEFDSAEFSGPIQEPSFAVLGALVGESFEVLLGQDLTVQEIRGAESIAQRVRKALPADLPVESVNQIVASFSAKDLARLASEKLEVLPQQAVALGESWRNAIEMQLPGVGSLVTTSIYTLGKVAENIATIDFVVSAKMAEGNTLLTGLEMSGTGVTHFDLEAGYFTDSRVEIKMSGEVQGMPMSVTSTVDVVQTLK